MVLKPIEWVDGSLRIIDQTLLPTKLSYECLDTIESVHSAIRELKVRGAPLIGITAAFGMYVALGTFPDGGLKRDFLELLQKNADYLANARPTAVNLFWALNRVVTRIKSVIHSCDIVKVKQILLEEAQNIFEEDKLACRRIGEHGFELLGKYNVLHTHCNAGGLATSEYGTALAPVYVGKEKGKIFKVFVDETRPLLQGARLTAFELAKAGIPVTLICDNMAASVMAQHKVDAVIVGADRIAANGDVANKIGTYGLALCARAHNIPFYVAAPVSTIDRAIASGADIPIEERDPREITHNAKCPVAPLDITVYNPAFDVTPHDLITAIITEDGVVFPPYDFRQPAA